jgi:hypothetical protein
VSDFEQRLRDDLNRTADGVHMRGDLADLESRIDRSVRHRDLVHNAFALGGAIVIIVVVVLLATVVTSGAPKLASVSGPSTSPPPTAGVPGGTSAAHAAVATTFATVFQPGATDGQRLALVDRTDGLASVIANLRSIAPAGTLDTVRVHVDKVTFPLPHLADVDYSITSTDTVHFPGTRVLHGGAVYTGGRWLMTRASLCSTLALIGAYCPENAPRTTTSISP